MRTQILNILMVTAWPPSHEAGGVSTVIRVLSGALSGDHVVHVLVNDWDAVKLGSERSNGLSTHRLRLRRPYDAKHPVRSILGWVRDFPGRLRQLRRLLRSQAIDVVHLHFASSYQFDFRILRMLGGPPHFSSPWRRRPGSAWSWLSPRERPWPCASRGREKTPIFCATAPHSPTSSVRGDLRFEGRLLYLRRQRDGRLRVRALGLPRLTAANLGLELKARAAVDFERRERLCWATTVEMRSNSASERILI